MKNKLYFVFFLFFYVVSYLHVNGQNSYRHTERRLIGRDHIDHGLLNLTNFVSSNCTEVQFEPVQIIQAIETSTNCLNLLNIFMFLGMSGLNSADQIGIVFNSTCHNNGYLNRTLNCFDNNTKIFSGCLSEFELQNTVKFRGILERFVANFCLDDGFKLAQILVEPNIMCFESSRTNNCYKQMMKKYEQFKMPSNIINDDNCGDLDYIKRCTLPVLKRCEHQLPAEYVENFVNSIMEELGCESNYTGSQAYLESQLNIAIFVDDHCQTRNSEETDIIINAIEGSTTCLDLPNIKMAIEMNRLKTVTEVGELFNQICRNDEYFTQTRKCFHSKLRLFYNCLSYEEIHKTTKYENILRHFVNYVCRQNGQLTARLFDEQGGILNQNNFEELENCYNTTVEKYRTYSMPSTFINADNCRDLIHLKTCMIPIMRTYENKFTARFTTDLLDIIMRELSCPNNRTRSF